VAGRRCMWHAAGVGAVEGACHSTAL
jgi:hypothetical protein